MVIRINLLLLGGSASYGITEFEFGCLDLPVDEVELGMINILDCAHSCMRQSSCLMFRYKDGSCDIIIEGTGRVSDVSNLYKIV